MAIIFMKLKDIKGDVAEPNHVGWINLTSASWSATRYVKMAKNTEGNREPGGPSFQPYECGKLLDVASYDMEDHFDRGKAIEEAEIKWLRTGDKSGLKVYRHVKLKHVILGSFSQGAEAGDSAPIESFSLCYIEYESVNTFAKNDNEATTTSRTGYRLWKGQPL